MGAIIAKFCGSSKQNCCLWRQRTAAAAPTDRRFATNPGHTPKARRVRVYFFVTHKVLLARPAKFCHDAHIDTETDMGHETDWEARCRLAQEVGRLEYASNRDREALAVLRNHRITPNEKCWLVESEWHGLPCIVECEIDEATGDGWDEPRYDAMASAMWVWIAGIRIDSGHFPAKDLDRWADEALAEIKQGADA